MRRFLVMLGLSCLVLGAAAPLAAQTGDSPSEAAARTMVRTLIEPGMLKELYQTVAEQMATQFEVSIQPTLGRALTDNEKQRLVSFWHGKIVELMPSSTLEDLLVPVLTKHLSLAELRAIDEFYDTPAGRKLIEVQPLLMREAEVSGEQLGEKLANQEWVEATMKDLKAQFPSWFPAERGAD
jgi:uncharacterized protein